MSEPIQAKFRDQMTSIMEAVDEIFNGQVGQRETGIVILTFAYGDVPDKRCNYISNGADRKEIAVMLKEMISRWEGMAEQKGGNA